MQAACQEGDVSASDFGPPERRVPMARKVVFDS